METMYVIVRHRRGGGGGEVTRRESGRGKERKVKERERKVTGRVGKLADCNCFIIPSHVMAGMCLLVFI